MTAPIANVVPLKGARNGARNGAEFRPSDPQRYVQIDEDGYFSMSEPGKSEAVRVTDQAIGLSWMRALQHDPRAFRTWTQMEDQDVIVEAFDAPYVVMSLAHVDGVWHATMPYGHIESFKLETLTLDEWDRFHGLTERGIPFVFSRNAQNTFFDELDSFDDESIEANGVTYNLNPWLSTSPVSESFWTELYASQSMPWDLNGAHPSLSRIAAAIKIQRSRILVVGCGRGHDAAWFARAGHIVTAVDYSPEAIAAAKGLYGDNHDLTFVQGDVFALSSKYDGAFDIVFDHTLYCAIDPSRRSDLVKVWRRALVEGGHLLGIFFVNEKLKGPPYGGSEWELRSRVSKPFRTLFWQRLRDSSFDQFDRLGSELFIYVQKRESLR